MKKLTTIDLVKQTPPIYSTESRDYQLLCRLYTALYNASRMYIDSVDYTTGLKNVDLAHLEASNVNFDPKHAWENSALKSTISCFKYLVKHKGTKEAIEYCLLVLLRAYNIYLNVDEETGVTSGRPKIVDSKTKQEITGFGTGPYCSNDIIIQIPKALSTLGVVRDLFDYLIPVGVNYRIIEISEKSRHPESEISLDETVIGSTVVYNSDLTIPESGTSTSGRLLYNAVTKDPITINNLTNTTWTWNTTKSFVDYPGQTSATYSIEFTSNNTNYSSLSIESASDTINVMYDSMDIFIGTRGDPDGFISDDYKTFTITGGTDANNPDLIAWLISDATQILTPVIPLNEGE